MRSSELEVCPPLCNIEEQGKFQSLSPLKVRVNVLKSMVTKKHSNIGKVLYCSIRLILFFLFCSDDNFSAVVLKHVTPSVIFLTEKFLVRQIRVWEFFFKCIGLHFHLGLVPYHVSISSGHFHLININNHALWQASPFLVQMFCYMICY